MLPVKGPASPFNSGALTGRIEALDGLRGIAAVSVVAFHYLYLLHHTVIPPHVPAELAWFVDSPVGILWNGRFAVSIFFVLSGFVMAGAADRRRDEIAINIVTRYLRLALPVLASVIFAWVLLSAFPNATARLAGVVADPSPWLSNTHQGQIPPLNVAVADGLVLNFLTGSSEFNNVLWTMQIELFGSIGIFVLYWLAAGRLRIGLLGAAGVAIVLFAPNPYLAFVFGALLYEAHIRGLLRPVPAALSLGALAVGILLGAPGAEAADRWGMPPLPGVRGIGNPEGLAVVLAATLILFAVLSLAPLQRPLASSVPQWLGRISFSLYLVHVPLLYTIVAHVYVERMPPSPLLAATYAALALGLAHVFTVAVDEPSLALLRQIRARTARWSLARIPAP